MPARESPRRAPAVPSQDPEDGQVRLVAAVAIQRGRQVLVIREEDEPHRHEWVLPQGHPRPGETLARAAAREAYEEVRLDVEIRGLVGVYEEFARDSGRTRWVTVCFLGRPVRPSAPVATREAIDSAWIDPSAIDPDSWPALRPMLADLRRALEG